MTLTKVTCNLHITKSRARHLVLPYLSDRLQLITFDHSILFHTFSSHSFQDTTLSFLTSLVVASQFIFPDLSILQSIPRLVPILLFSTHIHMTGSDLVYSLDSKYHHRHTAPSCVFPAQSSFLNSRLGYLTAY